MNEIIIEDGRIYQKTEIDATKVAEQRKNVAAIILRKKDEVAKLQAVLDQLDALISEINARRT